MRSSIHSNHHELGSPTPFKDGIDARRHSCAFQSLITRAVSISPPAYAANRRMHLTFGQHLAPVQGALIVLSAGPNHRTSTPPASQLGRLNGTHFVSPTGRGLRSSNRSNFVGRKPRDPNVVLAFQNNLQVASFQSGRSAKFG